MTHPTPTTSNRLGLDYRAEAVRMGPPTVPIIDAHTHINGLEASRLFAEVMDLYGIATVWSMPAIDEVEAVRTALEGRFE
ncbi:MAG: hypothetical protein ACYTDE_05250, partial [Planctomycetota bacterium]